MPRLLTVEDVAEELGVSVKTIYQWRSRQPAPYGPPAIKVGKYLRWRPDALREWIDAQSSESNVTPIRRRSTR
ncbi:helix-turn-helix transcriptional regulator [Microbacterium sp. LWH3-1.2]|uniref:helix-turn-helix transcriptional regulator n=1 Tax=Microbacterium sp. LWH3-1.2 TaxID=3135256 RepID=UPI00343986F7